MNPRRIFARLEWLPPGGHAPHGRLQAARAHHGAFKAPLRKIRIQDTLEELREMARDAVRCHFGDGAPGPMPKIIRLHFVRDEALVV